MPRATKCLHQIINFIEELEQKKVAYSSNGDVYFSVAKHKDYGKLSGREIENQIDNAAGRLKLIKMKVKRILLILLFGKSPNQVRLVTLLLGGMADQVGILSVQQWLSKS